MEQYIENVLSEIVTKPEQLSVKQAETWNQNGMPAIAYEIHCNKNDRALVVGKAGRNIKAIQHVVRIAGLRANKLVFVYLEDDIKPYERN